MVRRYGKPDLFITFTCNSNWPEIVESIHPWETPNNRPDIVVRVFHAKVQELLRLLNAVHIFGSVLSFLYVIEFQKRGLPHCHLLLKLSDRMSASVRSSALVGLVLNSQVLLKRES